MHAVDALRALGVTVRVRSQDDDLLQVQCKTAADAFGDEQMQLLRPLAPRIAWLDLGNTRVTDSGLEAVADMKNLMRLHLQNTAIGDAGLEALNGLKRLEYLNLYATKVTDEGLLHLAGCEQLRTLYLWRTAVTEEGIAWLQKQLPGLEVIFESSFFDDSNQSYDLL